MLNPIRKWDPECHSVVYVLPSEDQKFDKVEYFNGRLQGEVHMIPKGLIKDIPLVERTLIVYADFWKNPIKPRTTAYKCQHIDSHEFVSPKTIGERIEELKERLDAFNQRCLDNPALAKSMEDGFKKDKENLAWGNIGKKIGKELGSTPKGVFAEIHRKFLQDRDD